MSGRNEAEAVDDGANVAVDLSEEEEEEEEQDVEEGAAESQPTESGGNGEPLLKIPAVASLDSLYGLREIGREALCWQLSSAKPGNGVEQIRDHSTDTYWQSDGVSQPHWIQVHFARRVAISHVCLYLDYNLDESYTPKHFTVSVGMTTHDLTAALYPANTIVELHEPVGWCIIPLTAPLDPLDVDDEEEDDDENEDEVKEEGTEDEQKKTKRKNRIVRAHMIQISVLAMHQNGRDTHIRQVQLYGPRMGGGTATQSFSHAMDAVPQLAAAPTLPLSSSPLNADFTTELSQFSVIR